MGKISSHSLFPDEFAFSTTKKKIKKKHTPKRWKNDTMAEYKYIQYFFHVCELFVFYYNVIYKHIFSCQQWQNQQHGMFKSFF